MPRVLVLCSIAVAAACHGSRAAAPGGGEVTIGFDGEPNGIAWDGARRWLLIADERGNRLAAWSGDRIETLAMLPATADGKVGLGQPVALANGRWLVPRFGFGTDGAVMIVDARGDVTLVPALAVERRRIGLAVANDGAVYGSWFVGGEDERTGGVARIDLGGGETDLLTGIEKPAGVAAVGAALMVSDQAGDRILRVPIADPAAMSVRATVDGPDHLAVGDRGALFTADATGAVVRIDADGEVVEVASGFERVRGVAYDPATRRLFVADAGGIRIVEVE